MDNTPSGSRSRPSRAAKLPSSRLSNSVNWSQLSAMDIDDDEREFGMLAAGDFGDNDSDVSNTDWDEDEDSDDDAAVSTKKKPPKTKAKQSRSTSNYKKPKLARPRTGSGDSGSEDDDDDDEEASDEEDGDQEEMLDPAMFDGAGDIGANLKGSVTAEPQDAEEIEYEPESFGRLVESLKDTSREAGALRQTWDRSIEVENAEFENDLRAAAGFKKRKRLRRSAREQNLSPEVQSLLSDANLAFVEQRLQDAIPKLEEVIRIEPAVMSAWRTLGLIYEELGEEEKSIQCRIVGAHLQPGATEEWKRLAYRSISKALYRQAIYCFQQAIKIDKTDIDSIWDRALLLRDLHDYRSAINGMLDILKIQPFDPSVVREVIPMLVSIEDYDRGIGILENWRLHSIATSPDPSIDPAVAAVDTSQAPSSEKAGASTSSVNVFQISELVTLADLMLLKRQAQPTVAVLRQTARWLDGRASETFWDTVADDREFDGDIDPRIRKERDNEGYGRQVETASVHMLDPEIRLRLGKARMMMGDVNEAKHHFDVLTEGDPGDSPQIFAEVGDCFYQHKMWAEALDVLTDLAGTDYGTEDVSLYAKLAACNHALGELGEAARLYEPVVEAVPDNLEWQMGLAEAYEGLGEKERSLEVLKQVMKILQNRRAQEAATTADQSTISVREAKAQADGGADAGEREDGADAATQGDGDLGQLSFFDEVPNTLAKQRARSRSGRRSAFEMQEHQRLEQRREQETVLTWKRLELLDPHVFIPELWRTDVLVSAAGEEEAGGGIYASFESVEDRQMRYRQTAQWVEEAAGLIDAFQSNRSINPARKRKGGKTGARNSTKTARPRLRDELLATMDGRRGDRTITTQAKQLFNRLQDQIMDEDMDTLRSTADDTDVASDGKKRRAKRGDAGGFANTARKIMTEYRGLKIEQWIDMFAKYCFVLTKSGESCSIVNELMHSLCTCVPVWGQWERMKVVQLSWLSCAMYAFDFDTVFSCLRWLAQELQFHNFPLKLTASVTNALGFHSLSRCISNKDAKFYQRRMRYIDALVNGMPCTFNGKTKKWQVPTAMFNAPKGSKGAFNAVAAATRKSALNDLVARDASRRNSPASLNSINGDGDSDNDENNSLTTFGDSRSIDQFSDLDSGGDDDDGATMEGPEDDAIDTAFTTIKGDRPDPVLAVRLAKPALPSPVSEMFYGYLMLLSSGFQSSAAFFSRCWVIAPRDPLVCLLTTVSFVSRTTNRQTDNRHHLLLQAMSFLQHYAASRISHPSSAGSEAVRIRVAQEVDYNRARVMHHIGLSHLAVPHYQNVLASSITNPTTIDTKDPKLNPKSSVSGIQKLAAYNLSLIYITSGSPHLACKLYEDYLTV
ncbi:TPR-like protein [Testicularia cyperi]|uniref:TPR-like protein n=1 Tax=Testicularia cyperi TaxID=1882483 RepID=A0A317XXP5_9BASI|nr:TPR-like protein [Testicularia cyperi]